MDIESIKKKKTFLENYYGGLFAKFDELDTYYDLSFGIGAIPSKAEVYTPATARRAIDTATDHVMSLGINVNMQLWSETKKAKDLISNFDKFGKATIDWMIRTGRYNIIRSVVKNMFLYGVGYLKGPLYIPRLREKGVEEEDWLGILSNTFPFYFRSVHPRNIMFDPAEYPQYVIESFSRTIGSIRAVWPDYNFGDRSDTEEVSWWEYWSPTERQYFVDENEILGGEDTKNPYGFMPYEIGYGGFGIESSDGAPESLIVSLIAPALSSYKAEARSKTAIQYLFETNAYSKIQLTEPPGEDLLITSEPGEPDVIPDHYKAQVRDTAHVNPDMWRWLGMVDADQQRVMPTSVQGMQGKMTSGYQMGVSIGQARIGFDNTKKDIEKILAGVLNKMLIILKDVVQEPIGITGNFVEGGAVTLKPANIDYQIQHYAVNLDAETPEERDRRISLGIQLLSIPEAERGLSTESIITEYFGKDYDQELERILTSRAIHNPIVFEGMAMEAVKAAGMKIVLDLLQQGKLPSQQPGQNVNGELPRENDYLRAKKRLQPGTTELGSMPEMEGGRNEETVNAYQGYQ